MSRAWDAPFMPGSDGAMAHLLPTSKGYSIVLLDGYPAESRHVRKEDADAIVGAIADGTAIRVRYDEAQRKFIEVRVN